MILLVVIFILMMQFLWVYIDELVGKGLGFGVVAEFLFWGGCTVLPLALPLATLLASMMTIGSMGENNELIALKAAGISVTRVMLPLFIASIFITAGTFYVINSLVPTAYNKIYTLRDDIGQTKDEIKIPSGTFYDGVEGYVLRVNGKNDQSGILEGVMLYDHSDKGNTRLTLADSALMKMSKDKSYLTFTLYNGVNYQETNEKSYRDTSLQLQRIEFGKQEMVIPLKNYAFQKSDSARFGDQVKVLPLKALKSDKTELGSVRDSTSSSQLIATAASTVFDFRRQLDTAETGISTNFEDPNFLTFKDNRTAAEAFSAAAEKANQLQTNITSYEFGAFDYTVRLRRTALEFLKRYGQAIACLVMFFIGAPLGALIRRGGIGVSAIVSLLMFVLYWVIDITGAKLAKDGSISAAAGAFIASGVLLVIGLYLTGKAIHDKDLSDMDKIKNGWRKLKSKVSGIFKKTRIVFMGTPEFAVESLKALLDNGYDVVGVVTVADKPVGRGQKISESAVKKFAVEKGLPVLQPLKLKDPEFLEQLKALKADLFVVVAFRMLPEEVWRMPKLGTFNLHAALLPQYRGAAPINWAVINGETRTGATTFMIDKDMDTGGIILRQDIPVSATDTAGDVHDKLMAISGEMVVQTVQGLIEHNAETRVQRSFIQGSEVLKPAPKLSRELCHIDWNDTTDQIYNLIRGLSPYPAAFTELVKEGSAPVQLKIFSSKKVENVDGLAPGSIRTDGKSCFEVATADGALSLLEVQIAGKKRMDIKAFLAGFRDPQTFTTTAGTSKAEISKTKLS